MEPISMSAGILGATFLKEGIKFLWGQAGKIIDRHHKKKKIDEEKNESNIQALAKIVDPVPEFIALNPVRFINFTLVEKKLKELKSLRKDLSLYALGDEEIKPENEDMLAYADQLQQLLSEIFSEDVNVPRIRVQQFVKNIKEGSEVTGVEADTMTSVNIDVDQRVENIADSKLGGVKYRNIEK